MGEGATVNGIDPSEVAAGGNLGGGGGTIVVVVEEDVNVTSMLVGDGAERSGILKKSGFFLDIRISRHNY